MGCFGSNLCYNENAMSLQKEKRYFEKSFKAKEYLKNYYTDLDVGLIEKYVSQKRPESETARIMIFLAEEAIPAVRSFFDKKRNTLLELGGGPTLYQLFSLAEVVDEIHFTDYVDDNLHEVRKWLEKERGAFNWRPYAKAALMLRKDINDNPCPRSPKAGESPKEEGYKSRALRYLQKVSWR